MEAEIQYITSRNSLVQRILNELRLTSEGLWLTGRALFASSLRTRPTAGQGQSRPNGVTGTGHPDIRDSAGHKSPDRRKDTVS